MIDLLPLVRRVQHGLTLGVRVIATDHDGRLLLVRHTYVRGWHLPGGAVDAGESALEAAVRELQEEANVVPAGPMELFGLYFNPRLARRDHVACFRASEILVGPTPQPNLEIAEVRFFALSEVPDELSPGTARRLTEWREGTPPGPRW